MSVSPPIINSQEQGVVDEARADLAAKGRHRAASLQRKAPADAALACRPLADVAAVLQKKGRGERRALVYSSTTLQWQACG